ncbi:hypothetical protein [Janibacter sp. G368]|uniref:hypothetical protein n=1 Tax=Janibacter sp. G368 TaxID=3420441 RepID=UPI003D039E14
MPSTFYELSERDPSVRTVLAFIATFEGQVGVVVEPVGAASPAGGWSPQDEALRADLLAVLETGRENARGRQRAMFERAVDLARQLGRGTG